MNRVLYLLAQTDDNYNFGKMMGYVLVGVLVVGVVVILLKKKG